MCRAQADEVRTRIDRVKDSNLRVLEGNHNVIVGWSRLTIPMLQQARRAASPAGRHGQR